MTVQITIIGLGQIGASIGLGLTKIKDQVTRIGNDRDPIIARQAEKMGAVDKISINLPSAVRNADLVILAVPVDEIRKTIEVIAPDLKPGSVLVDTSPVKVPVMEWAKELLPGPDRYFAGLTPSLNPAYIRKDGADAEAHADLFQNSLMLITTMPGIDESAIDLVSNLTKILGATPLFADAYEADGLTAYSHMLPYLVSAALVNATMNQAGWREARKIAGQAYTHMTEITLHAEESEALGTSAMLNAENTTRLLDQMIIELREIRDLINQQDAAALEERLKKAQNARESWWVHRLEGDWEVASQKNAEIPSPGEMIGRLFGYRPKKGKEK
ncbi:MAG: prephenate dehydrogenase [Chloroflexi bacterium]|nr:prephenate dehydrogenase [Chloroflexota bacterium]